MAAEVIVNTNVMIANHIVILEEVDIVVEDVRSSIENV